MPFSYSYVFSPDHRPHPERFTFSRSLRRKIFNLKNFTFQKMYQGDTLGYLRIQFVAKYQKKLKRGDYLVSSSFTNARNSFQLKQGLQPATAGFLLNRLPSVPKSDTYRVSSVVWRKKKSSHCMSPALLSKSAD